VNRPSCATAATTGHENTVMVNIRFV